jgi:hypothetical protein
VTSALCSDCDRTPCVCAAWEEDMRRFEADEAERAVVRAETEIEELWYVGADGLKRRRP